MYSIVEGRDFALKGGKPGFRTSEGQWIPIDTEKFDKKELDRLTADYVRRRGSAQIEKDKEAHRAEKAKQDAARASAAKPTPSPSPSPSPTPTSSPTPTPTPTSLPSSTSKPTPSPTPSKPTSSASASTADKIKGGLETYKSQVASGDVKGAEATGKSTWALANPKLAAAAAERERTRGTSVTTNPQMADLKSKLPAPKPTSEAKSQPSFTVSKDPEMNKIADTLSKNPLTKKNTAKESYDAFDLVLEYLISNGHAESIDEAQYIMLEMTGEEINNVLEIYEDQIIAEEISDWVDNLIEEGYDLSEYSWDDVVEYYMTEAKYGTEKGRKKLAKKVRAGKDVGKKGAGFEKIVNKASKKYGKERATKIAAAAMWKNLGK